MCLYNYVNVCSKVEISFSAFNISPLFIHNAINLSKHGPLEPCNNGDMAGNLEVEGYVRLHWTTPTEEDSVAWFPFRLDKANRALEGESW